MTTLIEDVIFAHEAEDIHANEVLSAMQKNWKRCCDLVQKEFKPSESPGYKMYMAHSEQQMLKTKTQNPSQNETICWGAWKVCKTC